MPFQVRYGDFCHDNVDLSNAEKHFQRKFINLSGVLFPLFGEGLVV